MVHEKTKNLDNIQILYGKQSHEKTLESKNNEISVDYTQGNILKRCLVLDKTKYHERPLKETHAQKMAQAIEMTGNKEIIINNVFAFIVAIDIINDHDPQTIDEYRLRRDWLK